jgi:hypothetical protein
VYSVRGAIFGGNLTLIGAKQALGNFSNLDAIIIHVARRRERVKTAAKKILTN